MSGGEVRRERRGSGGAASGGALDCRVLQGAVEFGKRLCGEIQNLCRQVSGRRAKFHEYKFGRMAQLHPHFLKLAGEKAAEDGAGVNAGEIIAARQLLGAGVVAVLRVVEARVHIFRERDGAPGANVLGEGGRELSGSRRAWDARCSRAGVNSPAADCA